MGNWMDFQDAAENDNVWDTAVFCLFQGVEVLCDEANRCGLVSRPSLSSVSNRAASVTLLFPTLSKPSRKKAVAGVDMVHGLVVKDGKVAEAG